MIEMNTRTKMMNYRKWAKDKNLFLVPMYFLIASFSTEALEMIKLNQKGKMIEGKISLPSVKTWIKLYKNPKRVGRVLLNILIGHNNGSEEKGKFIKNINESALFMQKHPEKFKTALEQMSVEERKILYKEFIKECESFNENLINDYLSKPSKKEVFREYFKKPEFLFFCRVQAPCFILYGTYPYMLLRQAQNGDDQALEKLIRLDKSIIFEPKISEIIHQAQALKAQARMSMIKKAFREKPKAIMTLKKVKILLGGLISYFSIQFNQKLSAAEIRDLFDAISLDTNDDIDQDLGNMVGETFEKAIQRSRNFWNIILTDKK